MINPFFAFVFSFLVSMGLGNPLAHLVERMNIMDVPGSAPHKQHARSTPLAGGFLMAVTLLLMAILYRDQLNRDMLFILTGALVIFLFGVWDDAKGLSAGPKLVGQLIASGILIAAGVQVRFVTVLFGADGLSPMMAQALDVFATLFWLIGITNAMNMIDSMDGIVAGLGAIISVFFVGATLLAAQPALSFWAAGLFGLSIGLYFWNGLAKKFFLGDSGAQTMGFLLASLGIMYNPLGRSPESSWIVPIMLLGVPIFDTTLVVLSRIRRKQVVGSGRRDHTYHRLIAIGMQPRYAVAVVHLMGLTIGSLALFTLYLPPWLALTFFAANIFGGLMFLFWLERRPALDDLPDGK